MPVLLVLPWPGSALSQNSRVHWNVKAKATKKARDYAHVTALGSGLQGKWTSAKLEWAFVPPSNHRRDVSNVIGSCKAYIDGIADALGIDDSTFKNHWPVEFETAQKGGAIKVWVTPIAGQAAA